MYEHTRKQKTVTLSSIICFQNLWKSFGRTELLFTKLHPLSIPLSPSKRQCLWKRFWLFSCFGKLFSLQKWQCVLFNHTTCILFTTNSTFYQVKKEHFKITVRLFFYVKNYFEIFLLTIINILHTTAWRMRRSFLVFQDAFKFQYNGLSLH